MRFSRRDFVKTAVTGTAGLCVGFPVTGHAVESTPLPEEDGYKLWLRYAPLGSAAKNYRKIVQQIHVEGTSATSGVIRDELHSALAAMLGSEVLADNKNLAAGAVIIGTPDNSKLVRDLNWNADLSAVGEEGFVIRSTRIDGKPVTVIASNKEAGTLYGVFHFLRLMQTGRPIDRLHIVERPALQLRLMNHWDNLNGTIERGYAGASIWQWNDLPEKLSPRYADYARACASVGINGAVINNVNADIRILSPEMLRKVAALAEVWRPYGVRMYLSVNFASPERLGGLPTADPLDKSVADWWKDKCDEIYGMIPDFGGFLVKANSERRDSSQERPHRFSAARTVSPALRRDARDAGHRRDSGDAGVSRPGETPRLSWHNVGGVFAIGHIRKGQGIHGRKGARGKNSAGAHHRDGIRHESRNGCELVRASFLPVELVCLRSACMGPGNVRGTNR